MNGVLGSLCLLVEKLYEFFDFLKQLLGGEYDQGVVFLVGCYRHGLFLELFRSILATTTTSAASSSSQRFDELLWRRWALCILIVRGTSNPIRKHRFYGRFHFGNGGRLQINNVGYASSLHIDWALCGVDNLDQLLNQLHIERVCLYPKCIETRIRSDEDIAARG